MDPAKRTGFTWRVDSPTAYHDSEAGPPAAPAHTTQPAKVPRRARLTSWSCLCKRASAVADTLSLNASHPSLKITYFSGEHMGFDTYVIHPSYMNPLECAVLPRCPYPTQWSHRCHNIIWYAAAMAMAARHKSRARRGGPLGIPNTTQTGCPPNAS